jgi:hypothetical protein
LCAQRHNNLSDARDCFYFITFDENWKPRSILEGQILINGEYVTIDQNKQRYFIHRFQDSAIKIKFSRKIYLRKKEVEEYILMGRTNVSENKPCWDYYGYF